MSDNVFEKGDAGEIIDLVSSIILHPDDVDGDNKVWVKRAVDFLEALIPVLVWKRENKSFLFNAESLYQEMEFENVIDLANALSCPEALRAMLLDYLQSLHGFSNIEHYGSSDESFMIAKQQHGYRQMLYLKALPYLSK